MHGHRIALAAAALLLTLPALAQDVCSNRQTPQQIDSRVDAMIAKMTLAERIDQLQDRAPAIPRLGLSAYNWWTEGLHGDARAGYATVFPQAIGLAATWDPQLMREVGDTVATEVRARFNEHGRANTPRNFGLTVWSPNINIFRDPRWGRGQETYGEDPYLTGAMGTQFVQGLQGSDPFYLKTDATPKHFVAHSGPEKGRDSFNAVVSQHDLADTYERAFHTVLTEGHASSLMCSYNEINGVPSCANPLLQNTVRGQWKFPGYIVSDCDAVGDISDYHHYAPDAAHGASAALKAGVDLDCGNTYSALQQAYEHKLISEQDISRALHRLLIARVRLGMMDAQGCTPYDHLSASDVDTREHAALALKAAEESAVLLKNDGTLPLNPARTKLAVVGPTADMLKVLEANYHGTASHPVTPLEGMRSAFSHVDYAQGSLLAEGVSAPIPRSALLTAKGPKARSGLTAEYFAKPEFTGKPAVTERAEKVDLDLDQVGPSPQIHAKQYAARWSGYLVPPAPGDYTLRVNVERCWDCKTHDSFRLYVDGRLAIENHGAKGDPDRVSQHFADMSAHAIRLELLHTGEDEGIALEWLPPAEPLLHDAVQAARNADVTVAFVGLSPDLEGEALQVELTGFDGGDRTSLQVPETQRVLLQRLAAVGKPLVVVLTSGSAVALDPAEVHAAAMLAAWYPGEQGGTAIANLLTGKVNPSGRLPITFYRSVRDLPPFTDYGMSNRTYRYTHAAVLFPFGSGLSYSTFAFDPVRLSKATLNSGGTVEVTTKLRNTSITAGTEVAEVYVRPPQGNGCPVIALSGFERVAVPAHDTREVRFALKSSDLLCSNAEGKRQLVPGDYRIFVGGTQPTAADRGALLRVEPAPDQRRAVHNQPVH